LQAIALGGLAYYLSMEFLIGRALLNNMVNLGLVDECRDVLSKLDEDLDEVVEVERDAGLGNGGLGRLAACYLDSLATLNYPVRAEKGVRKRYYELIIRNIVS